MRRAFPLLLALILLSGWQQALLHPLVHVDERGALVHIPAVPSDDHDHDHGERSAACDAVAALVSCIGSAAIQFAGPARPIVDFMLPLAEFLLPAATIAYRSQAPPFLS